MAKVGRPTKYDEKMNDQVYKLCLLGATDADISNFFEIAESTLNKWKIEYPEFMESIKKGKQLADSEVAHSLYQRAIGYSHPEDKIFNNGGAEMIVNTIKHYPPDTAAAFIWLKNRAGWKDKVEVDNNGTIEHIHTTAEDIPFSNIREKAEKRLDS